MIKNYYLLVFFLVGFVPSFAQNGNLTLRNDSTLVGYLRLYTNANDGRTGIEFWRTKKDKDPLRIPKAEISAYTLDGKTYKIFHHYKPFTSDDAYFEMVEGKLISDGKIKLYQIVDYNKQTTLAVAGGVVGGMVGGVVLGAIGSERDIYVLEDRSGYTAALPSDKVRLKESLVEFFPEQYVNRYEKEKGVIRYGKVAGLVKLYNSR